MTANCFPQGFTWKHFNYSANVWLEFYTKKKMWIVLDFGAHLCLSFFPLSLFLAIQFSIDLPQTK